MTAIEKIETYLKGKRSSHHPAGNYAYNAGHPCERHLVYCRLNWQEKTLPELKTLLIFREGNLHEEAVIKLLMEAGIRTIETQRPFELPAIELRGRIDAQTDLNDDGQLYPTEIKSMNPFDWERINGVEDIKNSSKPWIRSYVTQMQLYLLGMNKEHGVFILKNKLTGQLKFIYCDLDYEYAESEWKKLERVNAHVKAGTYPDRITDRTICQYCDFKHICLPDEASEALKFEDSPEILELLEERDRLKDAAKSFEQVDEKLRQIWKVTEDGTYLVGGKFQVQIKTQERTQYAIPPELKEKYAEKIPVTITKITKL